MFLLVRDVIIACLQGLGSSRWKEELVPNFFPITKGFFYEEMQSVLTVVLNFSCRNSFVFKSPLPKS